MQELSPRIDAKAAKATALRLQSLGICNAFCSLKSYGYGDVDAFHDPCDPCA